MDSPVYTAELLPLIEGEWAKIGFSSDRSGEEIIATIALLQPRARSLKDFAGAFRGYFSDAFEYDTAAVAKFLPDEKTRALLVELGDRYQTLEEFTESAAEQLLRAFAEEKGVKAGALINGSRVALTGQAVAPSLFAVMAALGKDRVVKRLKAAGSIASTGGVGVVREWENSRRSTPLRSGRDDKGEGSAVQRTSRGSFFTEGSVCCFAYWATTVTVTGMVCGGMQEFASQAW